MASKMIAGILSVVAALAAATCGAQADDTGLASMHAWVKVGKRTCYAEHTHYASSVGHRDKRTAMAAAAKSWTEFTSWEYGTDWGNFNNANAKQATCTQSASGWACDVQGRPCRGR